MGLEPIPSSLSDHAELALLVVMSTMGNRTTPSPDPATFPVGELTLQLKQGLYFYLNGTGEAFACTIEDPSRGNYFRVSWPEYVILSLIDGKTPLSEIVGAASRRLGQSGIGEMDTIRLFRMLIDADLAYPLDGGPNHAQSPTAIPSPAIQNTPNPAKTTPLLQPQGSLWNPISFRVSLGNPDRWIAGLTRAIGCLLSWPLGILWGVVLYNGLISVLGNWSRIGDQGIALYGPMNGVWLCGTWLVLKLGHELGHAVACRRLGGKVTDWGVVFLLLVPLPYVDVTSCWRMPHRWQRLLVSAAGILVELFIASLAAIVWSQCEPGMMQQHAFRIMFLASVNTVVFNANPLMRLDGYYLLTDSLNLPGLAFQGDAWLRAGLRRLFFGLPSPRLNLTGWRRWFIPLYGLLARFWRIVLTLSLIVSAYRFFPGLGPLLALVGITVWILLPLQQLTIYLWRGATTEQPNRRQFSLVFGGGFVTVSLLIWILPAPGAIRAHGVVTYISPQVVRAVSPGIVSELHVQEGSVVRLGTPLITLQNPELQLKRAELERKIAQAQLEADRHQARGSNASWQSILAAVDGLEQQQKDLERAVDRLVLVATKPGVVVTPHPDHLLGRFVSAGTELLTIADPCQKQITAAAQQFDLASLQQDIPLRRACTFRPAGQPSVQCQLKSILPQATDRLPHLGLGGSFGGPIDVAFRDQVERPGDRMDTLDPAAWMILSPRLELQLEIDKSISERLLVGQTGLVKIPAPYRSFASFCWGIAERTAHQVLRQN